jgi:hypothetical protein
MKKFARFLGIFVLILGISLAFGAKSGAADKAGVQKIVDHVDSLPSAEVYSVWNGANIMHLYQNTGLHDNFPTSWKEYYVFADVNIGPAKSDKPYMRLIVRDYQNYYTVHESRGYVIIVLADFENDGVVDAWAKDYVILLDEGSILKPRYPEGLINRDWFELSREEAQEIYDKEIKYVLERIEKGD